MIGWATTFALTLAVELLVAYPLLGLELRSSRTRLGLILAANLLTHPAVYAFAQDASSIVLLELSASLFEAAIFARALDRSAFPLAIAASFLANTASLTASVVKALACGP